MVRHLFAQQPVIDGSGLFNQSGNGEFLKQPPTATLWPNSSIHIVRTAAKWD